MADPEDYDRDEVVMKWVDEVDADDENIEAIDVQPCSTRLYSILLHFILSCIFLGVCAGALIYSFVKGEAGSGRNDIETRDASVNFTIYVNEFAASGVYRRTLRKFDANHPNKFPVETTNSFWYQDNKLRTIAHKIDEDRIVYIFNTTAFVVVLNKKGKPHSCYRKNMTYDLYVERLGLSKMSNPHSEMEITQNSREVFIYDGDPASVLLEGTDERAFLVRAYADHANGALLGWDTYFGATNESKIYKTEYWYPTMIPTRPPQEAFNLPAICVP